MSSAKFTFSLAISADCSLVTAVFDTLDVEARSACSCKDRYKEWRVSNKNRSPPCLAMKETDTGHFSWNPRGIVTWRRYQRNVGHIKKEQAFFIFILIWEREKKQKNLHYQQKTWSILLFYSRYRINVQTWYLLSLSKIDRERWSHRGERAIHLAAAWYTSNT